MGVESIWQYSTIHDCICKVIETKTLWGDTTCCVWLPGLDSVVSIPVARNSLKEMRLHDPQCCVLSQPTGTGSCRANGGLQKSLP